MIQLLLWKVALVCHFTILTLESAASLAFEEDSILICKVFASPKKAFPDYPGLIVVFWLSAVFVRYVQ